MLYSMTMRTTVVLDDRLFRKIRQFTAPRGLSAFINQCLKEHFARAERSRRERALEKAYARAAGDKDEFVAIEVDEWPE